MNTRSTDTANSTDTTIQKTIVQIKQANRTRHINIDNRIGMNTQGPIITNIPESNRANNCDIFYSVSRNSDLAYRGSVCHDKTKSDSET